MEDSVGRRLELLEGALHLLGERVEQTREAWRAGTDYVARVLQRGMDEGLFHPDDPERLAGSVMAVMQVQLAGLLHKADADAIAGEILVALRRMLCVDPEADSARRVA